MNSNCLLGCPLSSGKFSVGYLDVDISQQEDRVQTGRRNEPFAAADSAAMDTKGQFAALDISNYLPRQNIFGELSCGKIFSGELSAA